VVGFPVYNPRVAVAWGANLTGQLGDGTTTSRAYYGPVSGLGSFVVQVAAGGTFALALRSDGTVWAWGSNASGQLGDGNTNYSTTPVQVGGLTNVVAVAAGISQSLALRSDGTVWAWGGNQYGELGIGTTSTDQLTPVQVRGLTGVTKISAGGLFSLALRSDGTVWAWGDNAQGELGNGTTANSDVPVRVPGLSQVTRIDAGYYCSLAVSTGIGGATPVWTWGGNDAGDLGDGTLTDRHTPEQVTGIGAPAVTGLAIGNGYALALGSDGSVWAWGADTWGQLGNAPQSAAVTCPILTIAPGSGITQLASGVDHVLALRANGTVLAWGRDYYGELGDGNSAPAVGPVQVAGLSGASQVSAGWEFSLALYTPPRVAL